VLSNIKQKNFLKLVEESTDISDIDYQNKITNIFFIMTSNKYDSYHRKYIKAPEIIALVGGLMKAITFIMSIIVQFFSEFDLYNKLINQVYKIENSSNNNNLKNNNFKKVIKLNYYENQKKESETILGIDEREKHIHLYKNDKQRNNSESGNSFYNRNKMRLNNTNSPILNKINFHDNRILENSRNFLNNPFETFKKKSEISSKNKSANTYERLDFSLKEKLHYLLCRCQKKKREKNLKFELMDKGMKNINDNLEICKIMIHFEEYKILKKTILSEEKAMIFEEIMSIYPSLNDNIDERKIEIFKKRLNLNNKKARLKSKANKNIINFDSSDKLYRSINMNMLNMLDP